MTWPHLEVRRSSATGRFRRIAISTRPGFHRRTCRLATRSSCRWRSDGPKCVGARAIVLGVNALDYSGYPDCRPEYLDAFERLASLATTRGRRGAAAANQGAAAAIVEGGDHPRRADARPRLRPHAQLLRSRSVGESLSALRQLPAARARIRAGRRRRSRASARRTAIVTERLYYSDSYLTEFDATVVRVEHEGTHRAVILDRTAFYPTSGGQPFDTGQLGAARVVDVVDGDDGEILTSSNVSNWNRWCRRSRARVHGTIDWERRFEHMQQHTGQHVLSAAFDRVVGARTESFHLGSASSTIDLNRTLSAADIERAENEANRIVWEDRPVAVRFASADEAASLPLRKGIVSHGHTSIDRSARLRHLSLRRHARGADRRNWNDRGRVVGTLSRRHARRVPLRRARAPRRIEGCATRWPRACASCRSCRRSCPTGIERLQAETKDMKRQIKDLQIAPCGFRRSGAGRSRRDVSARCALSWLRLKDGIRLV